MSLLFILVIGLFCLKDYSLAQNETSRSEACKRFKTATFYKSFGLWESNTCLNQTYIHGHQVQFQDVCSVEPEDESLSYVDSVWKFYKCIVEKSLGSTPLTMTSYAEMMSGNLSVPVKSAIVSILETNQNNNEAEKELQTTEGRMEEFFTNSTSLAPMQPIEEYWHNYFDAEFQVCSNASITTCSEEDLRESRWFWTPHQWCSSKFIPAVRNIFRSTFNRTQCVRIMKGRHNATGKTGKTVYFAINSWCNGIYQGVIKEQDENVILDFEQVYANIIAPGYYSKSVKRDAFKSFQTMFAKAYSSCNDTISKTESPIDVLNCAVQSRENGLRTKGCPEEKLVFLTNAHLLEVLIELSVSIPKRLCHP